MACGFLGRHKLETRESRIDFPGKRRASYVAQVVSLLGSIDNLVNISILTLGSVLVRKVGICQELAKW